MRASAPSSRRVVSNAPRCGPGKITAAIQRPGSTPASVRALRMARTISIRAPKSLSAASSRFGPGPDHDAPADVRQLLPQRLSDERHERVQETDGALHGVGERLRDRLSLGGGTTLPDLGRLDVPIAQFRPDELADGFPRLSVLVDLHQASSVVDSGVEAAEDPAIGQREVAAWSSGTIFAHDDLRLADRPQRESGGVPELVGEVAGIFDFLNVEAQIR